MRYKFSKEQLEQAVKNSLSIAQVCRELSIRPVGGNYKTLKQKFKDFNINTSHFTGMGWNVGLKFNPKPAKNIYELLTIDSNTGSCSLKKRLFKENLKENKCECCGLTTWNDKEIILELDHINGINTDNRLQNLRILCPNCHSQTSTFRGKSKLSALSEKREVEYRKFKETLTSNVDGNLEPSLFIQEGAETLHDRPKTKIIKPLVHCKICGNECKRGNVYCSYECKNIAASTKIPTYIELTKAFEKYKNFLQVGKFFNVSDNSVRKWCIKYGILDMVKKKSSAQTD